MPNPNAPHIMPYDFKDILNIHSYFRQNDKPSDAGRDIMNKCEEHIKTILTEMRSSDIFSGNFICPDNNHNA